MTVLLKDNSKNAKLYQNKDSIYLYNIFWKFNDDNIDNDEYLTMFMSNFNELIGSLSAYYPILNKFKFDVLTIQDVRKGALSAVDPSIKFPEDIDERLAFFDKLANENMNLRSNFNKKQNLWNYKFKN